MLSPVALQLHRSQVSRESSLAIADAFKAAAAKYATGPEWHRISKLARRIEGCAVTAQARVLSDETGATFVGRFNNRSCRSRFCMECARSNAAEDRKKVNSLIERALVLAPDSKALFLTLTSRNQSIENIGPMFDAHDQGLRRFWRSASVQRSTLGSFTAMEVDIRGTAEDPQAGVHSHSLVFIDAKALSDHRYLPQRQWSKLWGQALHVSYRPVVDVRVIRDKTGADDNSAVRAIVPELTKYVVDPKGLIDHEEAGRYVNPQVLVLLSRALHRRRIHRSERLLAEAEAQLRAEKRKQKDQTKTSNSCADTSPIRRDPLVFAPKPKKGTLS